MKEVIIKVYVEKETSAKKRRTIPIPILSRRKRPPPPRGFDRRAELLAYTKKLRRNADNSSTSKKTSTKKYNNKVFIIIPIYIYVIYIDFIFKFFGLINEQKWRWSSISFPKINLLFRPRSNRQWRYETINTENYDNNIGSSCCGQNIKRKFRFCVSSFLYLTKFHVIF